MPKIPPQRPRDLVKKFEKVGFVVLRQKGSHVVLFNAEKKLRIVIPLHTKTLPTGTLLAIIKDSGLTKEEFLKLK